MPGEVTKSGPKKQTQAEDRSDFPHEYIRITCFSILACRPCETASQRLLITAMVPFFEI